MIDPSQVDPLTLAMLSQRMGGGPNVRNIAIGGGSQLVMTPQQQSQLMMARSLMSQPSGPMSKNAAIGNVIQNGLGAFMQGQVMRDAEEQQKGDAKTMADALRTWQGRPAETARYTDQQSGDPVTINWNAQPGNKGAAMGMLAGNPRLAPQALNMQMQDDMLRQQLALKQMTTLGPEEVAKMGLPAGSVVQRDAFGGLNVVNKPDDTWISPKGGAPLNPNAPAPQPSPQGGTQTVPRPGVPAGTPAADYPVSPQARGTIGAESGGNPNATNPNSTATGAGQFIESTWLDVMRKSAPGLVAGKSPEEILAMREDPEVSAKAVDWLAQQNAPILQKAGVETSPQNLYLAHVFGASGAAKLAQADPRAPAANQMPANVVEANRSLFFDKTGRPKTVQETRDQLSGNFNKGYQVADAGNIATDAMPAGPASTPQQGGQWQQFLNKKTGEIVERNTATNAIRPYQEPPKTNDALMKLHADRVGEMYKSADSLNNMLPDLDRLEGALGNFQTGAGADIKLDLMKALQSAGFDVKGADQGEIIRAIQNRLGPGIRPSGSGSTSDRDMKIFMDSLPNLTTTVEGNRQIIDYVRRIAARKQQVADLANDYLTNNSKLDSGFTKVVNDLPPIFDKIEVEAMKGKPASPSTPPAPDRAALEAEMRRRGLLK